MSATWQTLASLFMIAIEGGAILVPMLVGAAARQVKTIVEPVEATLQSPGPMLGTPAPATGVTALPVALPSDITDRTRQDILDAYNFLGDQVDEAAGERIQAATFYLVYSSWKQGRNEQPMALQQFGKLMSKP